MNPTIPADIHESLAALVAYLSDSEQLDYEAQGMPAGHIFEDVRRVSEWLEMFENGQEKTTCS